MHTVIADICYGVDVFACIFINFYMFSKHNNTDPLCTHWNKRKICNVFVSDICDGVDMFA